MVTFLALAQIALVLLWLLSGTAQAAASDLIGPRQGGSGRLQAELRASCRYAVRHQSHVCSQV